ncbi:Glycosyltransferase involved in cell wall bisynthesis [Nocardioides terrae]|uniref:Glycosyltransferase involved in cell wall bisynthesis n=2 Tax=Nocardioides terrae TaxID=574651 RepID=A0A1I1HUV0_9ACTN|nr:Glycosyltransferase involved in cell wall bisynthesis [Nocardioides terrae]
MLGTRGVPAAHGGFETAVENIGLRLVDRGWRVVVYCQDDDPAAVVRTDTWKGIERVHVPSRYPGAKGTLWFDTLSVRHAARYRDVCVTFGYNSAMLTALLRARGIPNLINMDGIEWKRARWTGSQKVFLYGQERAACHLGSHLIADHPEIKRHLATRVSEEKIKTIAYGAPTVVDAPVEPLLRRGLSPGDFLTLVARPVPENSILEVLRAFSSRSWGRKLVVLGDYDRADPYQRAVLDAASDEVVFLGAIYDTDTVEALRFHSVAYLHGHQVGGTNPSLVEALGCGNPVIAHDNRYNRWVAGDAALYFSDENGVVAALDRVLSDPAVAPRLAAEARARHAAEFTWERITDQYETLIRAFMPARRRRTVVAVRPSVASGAVLRARATSTDGSIRAGSRR